MARDLLDLHRDALPLHLEQQAEHSRGTRSLFLVAIKAEALRKRLELAGESQPGQRSRVIGKEAFALRGALQSFSRSLDGDDEATLGLPPEPLFRVPSFDPKAAQSVPVAPRYAAFRGRSFLTSLGGAKNAAIISPMTLFAA